MAINKMNFYNIATIQCQLPTLTTTVRLLYKWRRHHYRELRYVQIHYTRFHVTSL